VRGFARAKTILVRVRFRRPPRIKSDKSAGRRNNGAIAAKSQRAVGPQGCLENRIRLQHSAFWNPSTSCPVLCHGCPVELKSPVTRENLSETEPLGVLAGLVPAIPRRMRSTRPHAAPLQETFEVGAFRTAWMPGQARARRAVVVCDLRFTAGLAEPDSRGLVLGIHAQKPSPGEARRI
jgi:hypothetical protein